MEKSGSRTGGYLLAAALGAVAGGLAVAIVGKVIPGLMSNMMAQMGGEGCDPEEM